MGLPCKIVDCQYDLCFNSCKGASFYVWDTYRGFCNWHHGKGFYNFMAVKGIIVSSPRYRFPVVAIHIVESSKDFVKLKGPCL